MSEQTIQLSLEQVADYEFRVRFDGTALPGLTTDEPAPLGHDGGPNPSRLLLAGVANCLAASLLFALKKFKNQPGPIGATARADLARNDAGRWRIAGMDVDLRLSDPVVSLKGAERALAQFEDFCIVTESVRSGIPVAVRVRDHAGMIVHTSGATADGPGE